MVRYIVFLLQSELQASLHHLRKEKLCQLEQLDLFAGDEDPDLSEHHRK